MTGSKADLAKCLETFQNASFFFGTEFPNSMSDIPIVCDKMVKHATGKVLSSIILFVSIPPSDVDLPYFRE